jgi:hypothetical protein
VGPLLVVFHTPAFHDDPSFKGTKKGLIYRAPVINILRNPYWGRNEEAYGEDPYLTGRIGVAYVKGLQGNDPLIDDLQIDQLKVGENVPKFIGREEMMRKSLFRAAGGDERIWLDLIMFRRVLCNGLPRGNAEIGRAHV